MYYDKISNKPGNKEIAEKIEEAFVEGSDWRIDSFKSRLKTIQNNFRDFELSRVKKNWKKPVLLEKRFRGKLFEDLPEFDGIIDAYFDNGVAIDWKTGNYEEMDSGRMLQGKVYEMLLRNNELPVKQVLFNNLNLGRQMTLPKIIHPCSTLVNTAPYRAFPTYGLTLAATLHTI